MKRLAALFLALCCAVSIWSFFPAAAEAAEVNNIGITTSESVASLTDSVFFATGGTFDTKLLLPGRSLAVQRAVVASTSDTPTTGISTFGFETGYIEGPPDNMSVRFYGLKPYTTYAYRLVIISGSDTIVNKSDGNQSWKYFTTVSTVDGAITTNEPSSKTDSAFIFTGTFPPSAAGMSKFIELAKVTNTGDTPDSSAIETRSAISRDDDNEYYVSHLKPGVYAYRLACSQFPDGQRYVDDEWKHAEILYSSRNKTGNIYSNDYKFDTRTNPPPPGTSYPATTYRVFQVEYYVTLLPLAVSVEMSADAQFAAPLPDIRLFYPPMTNGNEFSTSPILVDFIIEGVENLADGVYFYRLKLLGGDYQTWYSPVRVFEVKANGDVVTDPDGKVSVEVPQTSQDVVEIRSELLTELVSNTVAVKAVGVSPASVTGGAVTGSDIEALYDITIKSGGVNVQTEGYSTVRIPVPEGSTVSASSLTPIYVDDNNVSYKLAVVSYSDIEGWVEFRVNHFSKYGLAKGLISTAAPASAPAYVHTAPGSLHDDKSGVTVSGDMPVGAGLTVWNLENALHSMGACLACDEIRAAKRDGLFISGFDIRLLPSSATGKYTISIPVGSKYNGKEVSVIHCKDGSPDITVTTVKNGSATVAASSLSPFAVVLTKSPGVPVTGGACINAAGLALIFAALALSIAVLKKRFGRN